VLELDHVIRFVPGPDLVDLTGFTVEPGRVHTGQGTRNVRVMFDRNFIEVLWIEHASEVAARGLDFIARCARPATAVPFGCVLRGEIPAAARARFVAYALPGAPGVELMLVADQRPDAPFLAVFETLDREGKWPARRIAPAYLAHACGATRVVRATFTSPRVPELAEVVDVRFEPGPPRLELELGGIVQSYAP
jgi:hypothetical protein